MKKEKIMSDITKLQTMYDVFEYIDNKHPGWIIGMYNGYSADYPELNDNWIKVCNTFKTRPQKIVLIERLELDDHFNFAELLSQTGFVVRTRHEFYPCGKCGMILPTKQIYDKLKENKKHTPDEWSESCINC
jgi:hypothetical protein